MFGCVAKCVWVVVDVIYGSGSMCIFVGIGIDDGFDNVLVQLMLYVSKCGCINAVGLFV